MVPFQENSTSSPEVSCLEGSAGTYRLRGSFADGLNCLVLIVAKVCYWIQLWSKVMKHSGVHTHNAVEAKIITCISATEDNFYTIFQFCRYV